LVEVKDCLQSIPVGLREPLIKEYNSIINNYLEGRWGHSELSGGKLCEVTYTILRGYVDNNYPLGPSKPRNMVDACNLLASAPSDYPRSVKIQIPRMIIALYEIRNNRGVGHVGGDVDENHMDATAIIYMSKWIMSELVRVFHDVDTKTATEAVEMLTERIVPAIWLVDGKYRVLDTNLSVMDRTLLILYQQSEPMFENELIASIEPTNISRYRQMLRDAHKARLIEYDNRLKDSSKRTVQITPLGAKRVEDLLPNIHIQ
jgi:hypothetical protein